ncbi:MAG: hypothetical protein DCF32_11490 [Leptolyngbya sp.]|nr:MAG: hypothetical protein DCF32_11490 [Leptolyngbya sp.]
MGKGCRCLTCLIFNSSHLLTSAKLSFAATGPLDLGGPVLDDVVLEQTQATPVPTPALLPGLVGLGVAALKQRKSKLAAD